MKATNNRESESGSIMYKTGNICVMERRKFGTKNSPVKTTTKKNNLLLLPQKPPKPTKKKTLQTPPKLTQEVVE